MKRRVSKRGFKKVYGKTWISVESWIQERNFLVFATETPKGYLYVQK